MFYQAEFLLTDTELHRLEFDLKTWVKNSSTNEKNELKRIKKQFIVSLESLERASPEDMYSLIQNFPWAYFTLKLSDIDDEEAEKMNEKIHHICRFENKNAIAHEVQWIKFNQSRSDEKCHQCKQGLKKGTMITYCRTCKIRGQQRKLC